MHPVTTIAPVISGESFVGQELITQQKGMYFSCANIKADLSNIGVRIVAKIKPMTKSEKKFYVFLHRVGHTIKGQHIKGIYRTKRHKNRTK